MRSEKFRLHYSSCNSGNIVSEKFNSYQKMFDSFIDKLNDKIVYILSINNSVFILDEVGIVFNIIDWYYAEDLYKIYDGETQDIFLYEYKSFEEAYRVALTMKEENPLCYESGIDN